MCASICTATSVLHGGFVLYNGGFTAGITILIVLPILEHYVPATREEMKDQHVNMRDLITLVQNNVDPNLIRPYDTSRYNELGDDMDEQ